MWIKALCPTSQFSDSNFKKPNLRWYYVALYTYVEFQVILKGGIDAADLRWQEGQAII